MTDRVAIALSNLIEAVESTVEIPAPNCSCHLTPPCGDCLEWGYLREALSEARETITKPPPEGQSPPAQAELPPFPINQRDEEWAVPHVRCSRCEARRTLNRHPDQYIRVPRCRSCGHNRYRVDKYRAKFERGKRHRCLCWRYHFPHRRGSGYCDHNPKMTIELLAAREGVTLAPLAPTPEPMQCPF